MPRHYNDGPSIPELIRRLERRVEALERIVRAQDADAADTDVDVDQDQMRDEPLESGEHRPLSVVLDAETEHRLCRYAAKLGQSKEQVAAEALAFLLKPFDEFGRSKGSQSGKRWVLMDHNEVWRDQVSERFDRIDRRLDEVDHLLDRRVEEMRILDA